MSDTRTGRSSVLLWSGVVLIGALQVVTGAWALLWPLDFFHRVPTVDVLPPYNEHLVRDVGAALLAPVPVLAAAAWRRSPGLAALGLASVLVFAAPHAVFHLTHCSGSWLDAGLLASVVVPAMLLVIAWRIPGRTPTSPRSA